MPRRKVRDIYGNWIWEEDQSGNQNTSDSKPSLKNSDSTDSTISKKPKMERGTHLEWRDWIALTIASLETIFLPAVVIVIILAVLVVLISHFR